MQEKALHKAFEVMNDVQDRLQQCADHCRSEAQNVEVTACKSSIFSVADVCEAQIKSIDQCMDLCRNESQQKAA